MFQAAELAQELGLNLGGADEEMKDANEEEDDSNMIAARGMPNFYIFPTFTHAYPNYQ